MAADGSGSTEEFQVVIKVILTVISDDILMLLSTFLIASALFIALQAFWVFPMFFPEISPSQGTAFAALCLIFPIIFILAMTLSA